jgi:DNA-binding GntR family transcriptional regulator
MKPTLTDPSTTPHDPGPTMPLAESAYVRLRGMILECELMPGAPLTEGSVVARLDIGKTPVREAMRRLVQEGLLQVTPRSGYTVAPITLRDLDEVFRLRQITEGASAALAAGRLSFDALTRLGELCEIGYNADDSQSILRFLSLNAEYHGIVARASGNRRLADLVQRLLDESQRMIHVGILLRPRSHEVRKEHSELLRWLRAGDGKRARALVEAHIESARLIARESLMNQVESSAA